MVFKLLSIRKRIGEFEITIQKLSDSIETMEIRLDNPDIGTAKREKLLKNLQEIKDQIAQNKKNLNHLRRQTSQMFFWIVMTAIGAISLVYPFYWILYRYDL